MAFLDTETSLYSAEPIELYNFVGTANTYNLTSYSQQVTSNATVYTPVAGLTRTQLKKGTQEDDGIALDIEIPFDHPLVQEYAFKTAPPSLTLSLYRAHRTDPNDSQLLWMGQVISFSVEGRIARLRVPAMFNYLLGGIVPAPRYQAPCNHILYDDRCAVDPALHQAAVTATAVLDNVISVDTLGGLVLADLVGGEMIWSAGGERRMITGGSGLDIEVTFPFSNLGTSASLLIRKGCDHSFATCKTKFSNGANFMGCPLVPDRNPFTSKP